MTPIRMLVVDDDDGYQTAVNRWTSESRPAVEIIQAHTAVEGMLVIETSPPPDLVITDLRLYGRGTGEDVINAAKAAGVPVVAMSGTTRAVAPGVEFISKDELRDQLPRLLGKIWLARRQASHA